MATGETEVWRVELDNFTALKGETSTGCQNERHELKRL